MFFLNLIFKNVIKKKKVKASLYLFFLKMQSPQDACDH